jgi:hypothetical protein
MKASLVSWLDAHHESMMACLGKMEATNLEANPEEMQSKVVHREVPKEDAAVKTGRALNKQHRSRNLAAERRRKLKDGSRDTGFREKARMMMHQEL